MIISDAISANGTLVSAVAASPLATNTSSRPHHERPDWNGRRLTARWDGCRTDSSDIQVRRARYCAPDRDVGGARSSAGTVRARETQDPPNSEMGCDSPTTNAGDSFTFSSAVNAASDATCILLSPYGVLAETTPMLLRLSSPLFQFIRAWEPWMHDAFSLALTSRGVKSHRTFSGQERVSASVRVLK